MAYPRKARQENPNPDATAAPPAAPAAPAVPPTQIIPTGGGAPRLTDGGSLRRAWDMTGTPPAAFERTYIRAQGGTDPGVVGESLRQFWKGAANDGGGSLVNPPTMPLQQAQEYLGTLSREVRAAFDERLKSMGAEEVANSRFWKGYQDYPEQMAALVARRLWTNKVTGSGPVADWLKWLGG